MMYAIATRAKRHGIAFRKHELAPLGIDDRARCWGLWVEGRSSDANSRLRERADVFRNESPHLVVSPIHPALWPTAFNLQVLMERRRIPDGQNPARFESFLGLTDALERFGVNVLFIDTAQVGYDLLAVTATCDFPRLRPIATALLRRADEAGAAVAKTRVTPSPSLDADLDAAYQRRVGAFQALGRLLLPRLADLECRLLLADRERHRLWDAEFGQKPSGRELEALEKQECAPLREVLVGTPRTEPADAFLRSLQAPWFLNEKVAAVGENSYFLSYAAVQDWRAAHAGLPSDVDRPALHDAANDLSEKARSVLYERALETLKTRSPSKRILDVLPPCTDGVVDRAPRPACAERLLAVHDGEAFERDAFKEFFQRQALVPIRVTAMPALAYARFWARTDDQGTAKPIDLRFVDGLLTPTGAPRTMPMHGVFEFLNHATGCGDGPDFGRFGPEMAVFANMQPADRCVRLRFARELVEVRTYLTLNVTVSTREPRRRAGEADDQLAETSQGLLRAITLHLLDQGFRIERCSNLMVDGDERSERTECRVIAKATGDKGVDLCDRLASLGSDGRRSIQSAWEHQIFKLSGLPEGWNPLSVEVNLGFVEPGV